MHRKGKKTLRSLFANANITSTVDKDVTTLPVQVGGVHHEWGTIFQGLEGAARVYFDTLGAALTSSVASEMKGVLETAPAILAIHDRKQKKASPSLKSLHRALHTLLRTMEAIGGVVGLCWERATIGREGIPFSWFDTVLVSHLYNEFFIDVARRQDLSYLGSAANKYRNACARYRGTLSAAKPGDTRGVVEPSYTPSFEGTTSPPAYNDTMGNYYPYELPDENASLFTLDQVVEAPEEGLIEMGA